MYKNFKIQADVIALSFAAFKDVLPAITKYTKVKTKHNDVILGKWQKKRK